MRKIFDVGMLWRRANPGVCSSAVSLAVLVLLAAGGAPVYAQTPDTAPDSITKSITFNEPVLGKKSLFGSFFTTVSMPGAINIAKNAGEPALPVTFIRVLLPPKKSVTGITVTGALSACDIQDFDLANNPVMPYQKPLPFGTRPPDELAMDRVIYGSNSLFPAVNYDEPQSSLCRGYTIFSVGLFPVKYAPASGRLLYYPEMSVKIELQDSSTPNSNFRSRQEDEQWVKNLVCNPGACKGYHSVSLSRADYPGGICDPSDSYDYVIITTTANSLDYWPTSGPTPHNWESLMDDHEIYDGLDCTLVTIQEILAEPDYRNAIPLFDDTQARMREFCKDAYLDWGISYVLIGADANLIPSRLMDSDAESKVDADIYFAHLDNTFNDDQDGKWGEEGDSGFDLDSELFIGRVTCDVPQDVSNWLTKCFYYAHSEDQTYLDNAAFYGGDTGWPCEGDDFIDYSAIKGCDDWLGPNPGAGPSYPSWVGFQYGFETWNLENPGQMYDMTVKWTEESPNPGGWQGGGASGLRGDISSDKVTLISGIAHANYNMSLDVNYTDWEALYHNTRPFFIHDYGCHCGDFDATDDGVLHSMLFHSDTELAFACVYNTGYGWGNYDNTGSSSSLQQKSFWDYMFDVTSNSQSTDNWQMGKAMAYSKEILAPAINWGGSWREIIQCCLLFGDPAQVLKPPAEPAVFMSFPAGLPSGQYPPGPETTIEVKIQDGFEQYVPGSGYLYYRFDSGHSYTAVPLTSMGGNLFEGVIPNTQPGDEPEFYFSAQGDGGTTIYAPWNAPADVYSFDVYLVEELFFEDFEADPSWSIQNQNVQTGAWEWGNPVGTSAQPEDDHTPDGVNCYVTGRLGGSAGDHDVDGGPTILTSSTLDLSSGDANINFYLWFHHTDYGTQQPLILDISNNNGSSWTRVTTITNNPGWNLYSYKVSDYVAPTSQIKIRFSATDNPNDDVVEAALDDLQVMRMNLDPGLWADGYSLSAATGGVVDISLGAGPANGNRQYLLLGSATGTSPGLPLPGGATLPIKWDILTNIIMSSLGSPVFANFTGVLSAQGDATATLDTFGPLDPATAGLTLYLAYFLKPNPFYASNYIEVTIEP